MRYAEYFELSNLVAHEIRKGDCPFFFSFLAALMAIDQELARLGKNSYLKAKKHFNTEVVVKKFLNEILSL